MSRVQRGALRNLDKKKEKAADKQDHSELLNVPPSRSKRLLALAMQISSRPPRTSKVSHRPRTAETRKVYELILSSAHLALGDQAQDIVRSAAEIILKSLKNENMKGFENKEVEEFLGPVTGESFFRLINLSKNYRPKEQKHHHQPEQLSGNCSLW